MPRSAPAIALDLAPSRTLRAAIVAAGVLAGIGALTCGVPLSFAYVVLVLAGVLVARAWRTAGRFAGHRLALMPDGAWTLRTPQGDDRQLDLRAATDLGFLFALTFGDGRRRLHVPVVADTIDADTARRLRVWLRDAHAIGGIGPRQ